MTRSLSLDALWQSAPATGQVFEPNHLINLPEPVQRYLKHAIAPGTKLASAVRLQMRGEIKLKSWQPFQAEQVIYWHRGMIWQATAWMNCVPICGSDRLVDGIGEGQWKILGLIPVMTATGSDVTRSVVGRMQGECMWLPSIFCNRDLTWRASDNCHAHTNLTLLGENAELTLTISSTGQLESLKLSRWGNPEGAEHHYVDFGGYMEGEGTFSGYTIPTLVRGGWYFGCERFDAEGEFFRATINSATYK
jgi:hypothetical protein